MVINEFVICDLTREKKHIKIGKKTSLSLSMEISWLKYLNAISQFKFDLQES